MQKDEDIICIRNSNKECNKITSIISRINLLQEKMLFFRANSCAKYSATLASLRSASEELLYELSECIENESDAERINNKQVLGSETCGHLPLHASDMFIFQDLIIVKTPLTFENDWRVSKLFVYFIRPLIDAWHRIYGCSFFDTLSYPFVCLVERRVHKFNAKTMGDNDNLETSKVINEIVRATGTDDNPCIMHYGARLKIVQESDPSCMYFYFVSCEYLKKHPDFLNDFYLD